MKKIIYIIVLITIICFKVNVYANNFIIKLDCPDTAYENSEISCKLSGYIDNDILNGISTNFSFENLSYIGFENFEGWTTYASNDKGITLGNLEENHNNIGTISFKVTGTKDTDASIKLFNIKGSNSNYDLLDFNDVEKKINIIEKVTTTKTTSTTASVSNNNNNMPLLLDNLIVENYNINFNKNILEYNLDVENEVDKINITAQCNSKFSILGNGEQSLNIGKNKFKVSVTDGDNIVNYIIHINRKIKTDNTVSNDYSSIEKELTTNDDIIINLKKNEESLIAKKDVLQLIENKNKNITYNILDNDDTIYSISFYGKNFSNYNNDIDLNIDVQKNNTTKYKNYFVGDNNIILDFNYSGELPGKTTFKIKADNVYSLDTKLNLYYFNTKSNELDLITKNLKLDDGYFSFDLDHCSTYVMSKEMIINNSKKIGISLKIILAFQICILLLIKIIIDKRKKIKTYKILGN